MPSSFVIAVIFAAAFVQGLTGFGSAMVAMALLPEAIGLSVAAPLVAMMAIPAEGVMLAHYRLNLNRGAVSRLAIGMALGVPVGILALRKVGEGVLLPVLGAVIVGYCVYALGAWRLPALTRSRWAFLAGWCSGVLGGAYNTSGPPVVIYGHCRRWPAAEFKGNLQAFFLLCDTLVVTGHAVSGNLTRPVLTHFLVATPTVVVGVLSGMALDRRIRPEAFRRLVLAVLLILGLRLLARAW